MQCKARQRTGKTTLFKSLIAQQLVARALAIADSKDQNFGMLVTSTAIKAVENIIDDLRSDPAIQELDWLWFHSGSNEQVQHELTRLVYSPVIFHPLDNPNFQNDAPNMLNVVVSRAKQQFIVVGNHHRLRQAGGYLKVLADTVAEDFLLKQGSQHPNFDSLSQTPRLQRYYRDCEHIAAFSALASQCE
ncbi:hypothetical protein [Cronobacter sakazakii]|uniref:hypothetical protein n=1 Tax=Cronobacter sakazakii TaxID=28141 RepID=UPI001F47B9AF|nr:hypothetical protein [Cronobacter sakazakii]